MKRVMFWAVTVIVFGAAVGWADQTSQKPLADVAKEEEARRKSTRKPAKVYTNDNLRSDISTPVAAPPPPAAPSGNTTPSTNATPAAPGVTTPPPQDQAYWQGRIKTVRDQMQRTQIFADSLQSRINALTTDFVNRDDPAQRARIEADRNAALAELERVKKELEDQAKQIKAIEDEARRAGVPSGWLRPGA